MLYPPPVYFPIERGRYEVGPGLKPFGTDFGNQDLDQNIFQLTSDFHQSRRNKISCLQERPSKYIQRKNLDPLVAGSISSFIVQSLLQKYPQHFEIQNHQGPSKLICHLTGEEILFSSNEDILDFLMLQIQEDIAILQKKDQTDWISYLHLCSPSHWAAEDKIGLNFTSVHQPVPGIDLVLKAAPSLTEAMIQKGPFVRFVWSFVTDTRLNHHPMAPAGEDSVQWKGRSFNLGHPEPFYLRIERQSTHGFADVSASLFTIGISFIPGSQIKSHPVWREQLSLALKSMSPESRKYKGLQDCFEDLIQYLQP